MATVSLQVLFNQNKQQLETELSGLQLPQDAHKVQEVITHFLSNLFTADGEFRQSLTMSEDYILQAALSMLTAQQEIAVELSKNIDFRSQPKQAPTQAPQANILNKPVSDATTITGTIVGSAVGGVVFGTWGAVIGAIAGTAIAIYAITPNISKTTTNTPDSTPTQTTEKQSLNTDVFMTILNKVVEAVDDLINTIRVQNDRLRASYQQQDKPSLSEQYPSLISNMEELFRAAEEDDDEEKLDNMLSQVELLKRSLKNYGLVYANGKIVKK